MSRRNGLVAVGLLFTLLLAGVVSGFASSQPDGLEKVAQDQGFAGTAQEHPLAGSPVAGYAVEGVGDERLSTGLAGVAGVAVTFVLAAGLAALVRRPAAGSPPADVDPPARPPAP